MKKLTYYLTASALFVQSALFAEGENAAPAPDQGLWQTMTMIAIAMVFFYFILYRPEQKRRKEMEAQRSSMKKGDKVTAMGIIGSIVRVQDQTVILKMYDGSKIEVLKAAISEVIPGSEEDAKKADKEDRSTSKKIELMEAEDK